jgi:hypothetical protein
VHQVSGPVGQERQGPVEQGHEGRIGEGEETALGFRVQVGLKLGLDLPVVQIATASGGQQAPGRVKSGEVASDPAYERPAALAAERADGNGDGKG